ncbi:hypothetical protein FEP90_02742 [Burkholderia multivorans]|nr:hypothetical protein [Burkholderia multivorans]MDR8772856.1 hypothetical protein [Burkholderia multivorans]MDR8792009.1 hypothetical protein [Burkholderia multivorans]MDR8795273.1 hypothetical protein [Burkholderia multivorans]MDR8800566.1 hypothetical protein [Burkholderia multivorans]
MEDWALQRDSMQDEEERCVLFRWTSAWVGMGSKVRKEAIYKALRMEAGCDASTGPRGRKISLSSARA